jgi:hypothetical protein
MIAVAASDGAAEAVAPGSKEGAWKWALRQQMWDYMEEHNIARWGVGWGVEGAVSGAFGCCGTCQHAGATHGAVHNMAVVVRPAVVQLGVCLLAGEGANQQHQVVLVLAVPCLAGAGIAPLTPLPPPAFLPPPSTLTVSLNTHTLPGPAAVSAQLPAPRAPPHPQLCGRRGSS